jgi:hypothetical protein
MIWQREFNGCLKGGGIWDPGLLPVAIYALIEGLIHYS